MPIKVPNERIYYYHETDEDKYVLMSWIPPEELKTLIKTTTVEKKRDILQDYPDGLEIKVSDEEFNHFENQYGLSFPYPPEDLLLAFQGLQRSKEAKTRYEIRAKIVEESANRLIDERVTLELPIEKLRMEVAPPTVKEAPLISYAWQADAVLDKNPTVQMVVDSVLLDMKEKAESRAAAKDKPWEEKALGEVGLTEGEEPMTVFRRIQQRSMGR